MNINYSQLSMHSWVWIFLFQQQLMCFQGAHLNDYFFKSIFSCSGLLYIYIFVFLSKISKADLSCLFSVGTFEH